MKVQKLKKLRRKKNGPQIIVAKSLDYVVVDGFYMSYPQYLRFYEPRNMNDYNEEELEARFERFMERKLVDEKYSAICSKYE